MTASHRRRTAASAILVVGLIGAVSACGSSDSSSPRSTSSTTIHCDAGQACSTTQVVSGDTTLTVASDASSTSQTVTAELVTDQQLHCPSFTPTGGALAIFSSTAADAPKTVTYTVAGSAGHALAAAYQQHPGHLGCFGSPQPFIGFVGPRSSRAVFVPGDGLYEAALLPCASVDTKPCFIYAAAGDAVTLKVQTGPGDPKIIG